MAINLNTNPYYDDFDESKNYLKILFKPGYAVQARELTQLQTSLQKQISRFGSHVFKDGSIVLNGQTTTTAVQWIDIVTTAAVNPLLVERKTFIGQTSGAIGRIIKAVALNAFTARLYFVYQSGVFFQQAEEISSDLLLYEIVDTTSYGGYGTVFSIGQSVFFVDGYFAFCDSQTIVLRDNGDPLNNRVGIVPTMVTVGSVEDTTLLDPSQGSYNFAAPGADRLAINLTLTSYDLANPVPSNFIELSRYEADVQVFRVTNASYSDLEVNLARRTYDESGDYTVRPFVSKIVPHIGGDNTKLSVAIGPGKAYVKGFEFESIATTYKDLDKALDTISKTNVSVQSSYGDYFIVNAPVGLLNYTTNDPVEVVSGGTVIGSARVYGIQYESANRYKLFIYDYVINSGYTTSNVTSLRRPASNWFANLNMDSYPTGVGLYKSANRTLIVPIQQEWTKTLLDQLDNSSTEFETIDQFSAVVNVSSTTVISAGAGEEFLTNRVEDYLAYNTSTGVKVNVTSVVLSSGNTSATIVFGAASFNATIIAPVVFRNRREKSKALQTVTIEKPVVLGTTSYSLGYSDCYRLTSVVGFNSVDLTVVESNITSAFVFDNGQTDEMYDHGSITLKVGSSIPTQFNSIRVTFTYFDQSGSNTGFFSVDSYNSAEIDYIDIPTHTSSAGKEYKLRDCLDFRPRRANNSTAVVGYGIATPFERISLDYEAYLPRIDKLVLTKERSFDLIKGVPSENPSIPGDLYDAMSLYVFKLPAYTSDPALVTSTYIDNRRYTMRDIGKIDKRVEKIEYYTALSLLERQAKDEDIYDNLGVERFKNGILVDSFAGHSVGEVNNQDYLCSIDKEARTLRPRFSEYSYNYAVSALNGARKKGDLITLPIQSEVVSLEQPFATGSVNLNPYQVFVWNGTVSLNPATDTWVDTQTKPDVVVNLNGENDIYTTIVSNVNNPASSGVVWNDWQTVVRGVSVNQDLTNQLSVDRTDIAGKTLETTTSTVSSSLATTTDSSSYRTGLQINRSPVSTVERSLGTKVTDVSVVPYIRSKNIKFAAKDLKPKTVMYSTFDNVEVTSYCTPAIELVFASNVTIPSTVVTVTVGSKSAEVLLSRKNRLFVLMGVGSKVFVSGETINYGTGTATVQSVVIRTNLITNEYGDIAGTFLIPNNSNLKFTTGEKPFRLADVIGIAANTAAETRYVAQGMSQSLERSIVSTRTATVSVNPTQEISQKTSSTRNTVVTSTASDVIDVTIPILPVSILCSEDESTGWSSDGTETRTEYILNYEDKVIVSGTGSNGTSSIVLSTVQGVRPGMQVVGVGIPAGTTVVSVGVSSIVISSALTAAVSGTDNVTITNIFDWTGIKFSVGTEPVRYTLFAGGKQYTTGFVGSSSYDTRLVNLGLPKTVGNNPGKLFFVRSSPAVTQARLVVDYPIPNTKWRFVVPCPLQTNPSVSLPPPSYSITPDVTTVSENQQVKFTVQTDQVADGSELYWTLNSSSSATASDFDDGFTSGSVIVANKTAIITRPIKADAASEGTQSEFFSLDLRTTSISGTIVARSQSVTILDTSQNPTCDLRVSTTRVSEGSSVTFTVNTTGMSNGTVLYYAIQGANVGISDFTDNSLTGSFTITGGTATITKTLSNDIVTEGPEIFIMNVMTGLTSDTTIGRSESVTIVDTSITPTYAVTPNNNQINEGSSVSFTVTTAGVDDGTILYYAISGTGITSADFTDNSLTGAFTITNNTVVITKTVSNDVTTEGPETFVFDVKLGSTSGTTVASSGSVTIIDTSLAATYGVSSSSSIINEGSVVTFTVNTTSVPNNTVLYYAISGTGITSADFTDATLTGSFTITNNTAVITKTVSADVTTEGPETFVFEVKTVSETGTTVASSGSVTISDTSGTSTYGVSPSATIVIEGSPVTFTVNTTDVANGTILYYAISGSGITSADFTDATLTGSFTITGGTASITKTVSADVTTEGPEIFAFEVKTDSTSGTTVASSGSVAILDTSGSSTYGVSPSATIVNGGSPITFTVNTAGVPNSTILYYAISGTGITSADFTDATLTGSFTITGGTASITKTVSADVTTEEGPETFVFEVKTDSETGTTVANSGSITITEPTYGVRSSVTAVNEGSPVTFTVNTTGVPNSTVLYYAISGTGITSADFTDATLTGSFTITGGTAIITKTLSNDIATEDPETFVFEVKTVSETGTTVASSETVTVVDTSTGTTTYGVSASSLNVQEGDPVIFNVSWNSKSSAVTTLHYTVIGSTSADDYNIASSGTFSVGTEQNGSVPVTFNITSDSKSEKTETLVFQLRTGSTSGPIVATSPTVNVEDTSQDPSYEIAVDIVRGGVVMVSNLGSAFEGDTLNYKYTWRGKPSSVTTLYYRLRALDLGGNIVFYGPLSNDYSPVEGTLTLPQLQDGQGAIQIAVIEDLVNDGTQNVFLELRIGSATGPVVATSRQIEIVDTTSVPEPVSHVIQIVGDNIKYIDEVYHPTATITFRAAKLNNSFTNISTETLYWRIPGYGLQGSATVNGIFGSPFFDYTWSINWGGGVGNTVHTVYMELFTDSARTQLVATSATAQVIETGHPIIQPTPSKIFYPSYQGGSWASISSSPGAPIAGPIVNPSAEHVQRSTTANNPQFTITSVTLTDVQLPFQDQQSISSYPFDNINAPTNWEYREVYVVNGIITSGDAFDWYDSNTGQQGAFSFKISCPIAVLTVKKSVGCGWYTDPVAQTFFVDARTNPDGIYVKSLDLYFAKKSSTIPVQVQLRPTVNGYPSSNTVIPFGTSSKTAGEIQTSTNGTVATNFEFDDIVHLAPGEHSFVVLTNTDEYEIYTATLGEFTLVDQTRRVTEQPTLGSMFKSQNSYAWTAVQEEDVKFRLHKCVFATNTPITVTYNTDVAATNGNIPYETFYTTGEVIDFANTNIDYQFNSGDGWVPYQLGSNVDMGVEKTLVAATPSSLQFKTVLSTTNKDITPVVDTNRLSNVLVHNIINNDPVGESGFVNGNAVAKYITRRVKLAQGFDATDLKVYLFANLPTGTSIKVYYKVSTASDTFFDDNNYTEMLVENAGSFSENAFIEYKYKTPFVIDQNSYALDSGERFDTFAIKIVMLSTSPTKVPQIRDLRVIALDD